MQHDKRYTVTKIVLSGLMYTIKKIKTLVTYEIAHSLDACGNCSIRYPPDDRGLTTETCRANINSI
jgi:hypothetical protein